MIGPRLSAIGVSLKKWNGVTDLWKQSQWRDLQIGWPEPSGHSRQHDIVEYLQFLRPLLHSSSAACLWEARLEQNDSVLRIDEGYTSPIWLPEPLPSQSRDHQLSLQRLVDVWQQHQEGAHGLIGIPLVLLLQANRFGVGCLPATGKSDVHLMPEAHLVKPTSVPLRMCAALITSP